MFQKNNVKSFRKLKKLIFIMYYNTYVTIKYVHLEWTTSNDKKKPNNYYSITVMPSMKSLCVNTVIIIIHQ